MKQVIIDHNLSPGKVDHCQITGSKNLNLVLDLGYQAPCDSLLTKEQLLKPEITYPLSLFHCPDSGLAQLGYVVDASIIYPPNYPYLSGISQPLQEYQLNFAADIISKFSLPKNSFCVDIGSNDGTLLTGFKRRGMKILGVEPTNVADIANKENGIKTIKDFFTPKIAENIINQYGRAKIITMTNVFAHMADLGNVMKGICKLISDDGIFISESHYLLDVLQKNQFDTIYHEHVRTYSLKSLTILCSYYGLEVFDVERASRYGGNIRVYIAKCGKYPVEDSVFNLLTLEEKSGLHQPKTWVEFRNRVLKNRDKSMEFIHKIHHQGHSLVGYSCPGRASTLINFYGIDTNLMPYIGELSTSLKLNKYLPGKHIPIVSNKIIFKEQPDYVMVFAWHYRDFIIKNLRKAGLKSKLIFPLPDFQLIDG